MFRDLLIAEAWQLRHQANLVPFQVFLSAAVWLEERYQRLPSAQTAGSTAFSSLPPAMRPNLASVRRAEEDAARAVRWRERAGGAFTPSRLSSYNSSGRSSLSSQGPWGIPPRPGTPFSSGTGA